MFDEDLAEYLKSESHVTAALTAAGATEMLVVPEVLSQPDPRPNVSYELISSERTYYCDGQDKLVPALYRFRCQARTYASAVAIAEAVRLALSGFRGTMGSSEVAGSFVEDLSDQYYADQAGREKGVYERLLDVMIHFEEEVPAFT